MEYLILATICGCAITSIGAAYVTWVSVKESKVVEANYAIYLKQIEELKEKLVEKDKELIEVHARLTRGDSTTGLLVTATRLFAVSRIDEEAWMDHIKMKRLMEGAKNDN